MGLCFPFSQFALSNFNVSRVFKLTMLCFLVIVRSLLLSNETEREWIQMGGGEVGGAEPGGMGRGESVNWDRLYEKKKESIFN